MRSLRTELSSLALLLVGFAAPAGCAGRTVEARTDSTEAPPPGAGAPSAGATPGGGGGASGPDAGYVGSGGTTGEGGSGNASSDGGGDAQPADASPGPPDMDAGPQSCADVGKFPGQAMCCEGAYCAGSCWTSEDSCSCQGTLGGCIWPTVCCSGMCVGPCSPACKGAYCK
jgi:hypothetical protein